jgi:hypothetical protein
MSSSRPKSIDNPKPRPPNAKSANPNRHSRRCVAASPKSSADAGLVQRFLNSQFQRCLDDYDRSFLPQHYVFPNRLWFLSQRLCHQTYALRNCPDVVAGIGGLSFQTWPLRPVVKSSVTATTPTSAPTAKRPSASPSMMCQILKRSRSRRVAMVDVSQAPDLLRQAGGVRQDHKSSRWNSKIGAGLSLEVEVSELAIVETMRGTRTRARKGE